MMDNVLEKRDEENCTLDIQRRALTLRPDTLNEEDNTVEVIWTTGARGQRFDWGRWETVDEELAVAPENIRLDRLNEGAAVLDSHNMSKLSDQIGVVVPGSVRVENGAGMATLRLSERPEIESLMKDIKNGIVRNISIGYRVHEYEVTEKEGCNPLYRAIDWEPYEISFVTIPFDAGAQVRKSNAAQGGFPCILRRSSTAHQETVMDEQEVNDASAENVPADNMTETITSTTADNSVDSARDVGVENEGRAGLTSVQIRTAVSNAGLNESVAFDLIARNESTPMSHQDLMADIGTRFAARDTSARTVSRAPAQPSNGMTMGRAIENAIEHRMDPKIALHEDARQFRSMSLARVAEEFLGSTGISLRGSAPNEIATRALHSNSDFPALMANVVNRRLRAAYNENRPTYIEWARRAPNAPNFKDINVVQMSAMPDLLKTNEAGEFQYGTASDGNISYGITTYGRIIGITRQTIVNDDLRALDRIATGFGSAARRLENRTVYAQLTTNPNINGAPLFHSDHANISSKASSPDQASLKAGRTAMRLQQGLQKEELNITPKYMLVPAELEQEAYQHTSSNYVPAKQSDINEFRQGGRTAIEPIIDAVLSADSPSKWYMVASHNDVDTVEYCYLDGAEGVQISSELGFDVDGVKMKASLDFAAAVIDYRGLYRNG